MVVVLELPTVSDDAGEVSCCYALTPPSAQLHKVVLLETRVVDEEDENEDEDSQVVDAASAEAKRHGTRNKADLRMQLGKADPYALLELSELRWRATAEDIRRNYRRLVLKHHPDKKAATNKGEQDGGAEEGEDEMFKAITDAFELLSNPKKRREFDSLDEFDDTIPTAAEASAGDFFQVFGPVFERNSRWSERGGAPLLGTDESPDEEVAQFYNFWFDFRSWRDFADADEYDPSDASFREEKRWMERQNDKLRQKRRKEEKQRIAKLVEVAYSLDPRVSRMQAREKEARSRAKAERNAQKAAERNAAAEAKAAAAVAAAAEADAEAERVRAEAAERKRQKESQARALRRSRGRLRNACKEHSLCEEEEWEMLCASATAESADGLEALCDQIDIALQPNGGGITAAREKLRSAIAKIEQSQPPDSISPATSDETSRASIAKSGNTGPMIIGERRPTWTKDELALLAKGSNKFPGGVADRWGKIAEFINHFASPSHARTADEVVTKTRDLRKELEKKAAAQRAMSNPAAATSKAAVMAPPHKPAAAPATTTSTGGGVSAGGAADSSAKASSGVGATQGASGSTSWTPEQQKALEQALARFPASVEDRWDRIEAAVPGKTRAECVARYKQIVAALKAKKAAAAKA
eukprot:scaffold232114_cov27-Tisochrysis_lutea.AAC.2